MLLCVHVSSKLLRAYSAVAPSRSFTESAAVTISSFSIPPSAMTTPVGDSTRERPWEPAAMSVGLPHALAWRMKTRFSTARAWTWAR